MHNPQKHSAYKAVGKLMILGHVVLATLATAVHAQNSAEQRNVHTINRGHATSHLAKRARLADCVDASLRKAEKRNEYGDLTELCSNEADILWSDLPEETKTDFADTELDQKDAFSKKEKDLSDKQYARQLKADKNREKRESKDFIALENHRELLRCERMSNDQLASEEIAEPLNCISEVGLSDEDINDIRQALAKQRNG